MRIKKNNPNCILVIMTGLPVNDVCALSSTDSTEETVRQHLDDLERLLNTASCS